MPVANCHVARLPQLDRRTPFVAIAEADAAHRYRAKEDPPGQIL